MSAKPARGPVFSYCDSDHPADLLEGAAAVTCFLSETAGHLSAEGMSPGISEKGTNGLVIILQAVENTINLAIDRL